MRRLMIGVLAGGAMLAVAAMAVAATTQTASIRAVPSTLPEVQRAGIEFRYNAVTGTTDADGVPPPTARVTVFLDRDYKIATKGLDRCSPDELTGQSTEEARATCRKALVGSGSAVARVSDGAGGHLDIPAEITAYNGTLFQGKRVLGLHIVIGGATTEIGLSIVRRGGRYGWRLRTIGSGNPQPIRSLRLNLKRSYMAGGERRHYMSARCPDNSLIYRAVYVYTEGDPKTVSGRQRCQ